MGGQVAGGRREEGGRDLVGGGRARSIFCVFGCICDVSKLHTREKLWFFLGEGGGRGAGGRATVRGGGLDRRGGAGGRRGGGRGVGGQGVAGRWRGGKGGQVFLWGRGGEAGPRSGEAVRAGD